LVSPAGDGAGRLGPAARPFIGRPPVLEFDDEQELNAMRALTPATASHAPRVCRMWTIEAPLVDLVMPVGRIGARIGGHRDRLATNVLAGRLSSADSVIGPIGFRDLTTKGAV